MQEASSGPAFTLAAKHDATGPVDEVPGPGEYEQAARASGKAYTMAAKVAERPAPLEPGPGEYEPAVERVGPAYTMAAKTADGGTARQATCAASRASHLLFCSA